MDRHIVDLAMLAAADDNSGTHLSPEARWAVQQIASWVLKQAGIRYDLCSMERLLQVIERGSYSA